ncbi:hypothetical protein NIES2135_61750 (plasmid) [Leptolyngbya boryana NIES-2135]|jgi:hypothetical protein|uniref:Peptidase S8/S53 domain-containing protein n=1 Tax=Leptolyngbya boryana NIES-2135 TaxID=1973484 RepID=A0A1Z4JRK8_LEPBY|nr:MULTISPECIES: S8 family peptidase [Leptolyngbya]BAY59298.1 hypothetical protein NIES2135_61750 [Leptolyngbya boryana NIES-2135]MBD2372887.1 S8 family peptidase [Leptolyngbya sp. FACHB-238]MBD2397360.1 S8 family peptidase [Leptolyngbya sp. FACHB-239]MBD2403835.1 S8 family peptidase [Leptolyngbya sp. FACHB-402]ULP33489.1 S8 family peptidase [Leptolyngbya boryana IU 594]
MAEPFSDLPHFYLQGTSSAANYTRPKGGGDSDPPPERDRISHANFLTSRLQTALEAAANERSLRVKDLTYGESGFYLEFTVNKEEFKEISLDDRRKQIELRAVRLSETDDKLIHATVFVPDKAAKHFLKKIENYRDKNSKWDKPQNQGLVTRLDDIRLGAVRSLFTDRKELYPPPDQTIWWEVWLKRDRRADFLEIAEKLNFQVKSHSLSFPEREILLALTNITTIATIIRNTDGIAELRIAKDNPSFYFQELEVLEQADWVEALKRQLFYPTSDQIAAAILDGGSNRSHSLLEKSLASNDMHSVDPTWGVGDNPNCGHGTAMAGVVLYGDLEAALASTQPIELTYQLESVKILPPVGQNDPDLYGAITGEAIARVEIQAPHRKRVICMAVTSSGHNTGCPSSWSAAIDKLCFEDNETRRLIVLPVGNIRDEILPNEYLDRNDTEAAENPSQAWNALVVGAYTEKVNITTPHYKHYQAIAPGGDLCPRSRTSTLWHSQWPIRPDVVFEGGNLATDGSSAGMVIDDLGLLTTHHKPMARQFDFLSDTSAATALATRMSAQILSEHPDYLPETVRALMVHSARWTPAMLDRLPTKVTQTQKRTHLLARYGFGVPSLDRALQSAKHDLTMIMEDQFQPFWKKDGEIKTYQMNFHKLPWPKKELEKLGGAEVELHITLSYFIQPNPGERGWTRRHSYASHGLRFSVKNSLESVPEFKKRINKEARDAEESLTSSGSDKGWVLGQMLRDRGSLHSDIWRGTAADLATKDAIGVYPVSGWWKEKPNLDAWSMLAPYTLIVSIRVPTGADIYTPVENIVKQTIVIENEY